MCARIILLQLYTAVDNRFCFEFSISKFYDVFNQKLHIKSLKYETIDFGGFL